MATGPDPSLSVPATPELTPGGTVVIPIDIDNAYPFGSTGAMEAILALLRSAGFERVGRRRTAGLLDRRLAIDGGGEFSTGEIGIDLYSSSPIQTTAGGSLATIIVGSGQWAVGSNAWTAVYLVNQVDPTGQRVFTTTVADAQGAFVLQLNNGQKMVGSEQLTAANTSIATDQTASEIQFAAHSPQPTAHFSTAHYLDIALCQ